jgi:hypothetical protein
MRRAISQFVYRVRPEPEHRNGLLNKGSPMLPQITDSSIANRYVLLLRQLLWSSEQGHPFAVEAEPVRSPLGRPWEIQTNSKVYPSYPPELRKQ